MLKLALFAMKILISMTYVSHFAITLTTFNVYWCAQFFYEYVMLPIVKRSFMKVGVLHLDCPKIWLKSQRWKVKKTTWGVLN
jgi:hypothetical protein